MLSLSDEQPPVGTRWRHVRRGTTYTVLGLVRLQIAGPGPERDEVAGVEQLLREKGPA